MAGKKVETRPLVRGRIRCAENHNHQGRNISWLGRLYVLWAAIPEPLAAGTAGPEARPQFHLCQTDKDGYLSPVANNLDPSPIRSLPLFEGVEYLFYFIRHPAIDLPQRIWQEVNAGGGVWGQPQKMALKIENVSPGKGRRAVKELVLRIPEEPQRFLPAGSDFYDRWVLFRGMPNQHCPPVIAQVKRLQYHLGTMRYPVGGQGHPYSSAPLSTKNKDVYANEGDFDAVTWNCVLAFQRDARAGRAEKVAPGVFSKFLNAANHEPRPEARNANYQITHSHDFVTATPAPAADARQADIPFDTVVESKTAAAIRRWLDNSFRKPGPVLISNGGFENWMDSRMIQAYNAWSRRLKELGFKQGLQVSNVLRDVRIGVQTGNGMVATSIHKSGFALDMTMAWSTGRISGKYPYPLYYAHDPTQRNKVAWIVYAAVEEKDVPSDAQDTLDASGQRVGMHLPADPTVEYKVEIDNWVYDATNPDGGQSQPLTLPGKLFLNVTNIARQNGYTNIPAHRQGWQKVLDPTSITCSDAASFGAMLNRLGRHVSANARQEDSAHFIVNGARHSTRNFKKELRFLGLWQKLAGRHDASPDVNVDPNTKEGESFVRTLRGSIPKNHELRDRQFELIARDDDDIEQTSIIQIDGNTQFPKDRTFILRPHTDTVVIKTGDTIDFPMLVGDPAHMEWWHFQFIQGYRGRTWGQILRDVGWTEEGLLGQAGNQHIYGYWGIGYSAADVAKTAT